MLPKLDFVSTQHSLPEASNRVAFIIAKNKEPHIS